MSRVTLNVPDIECEHCEMAITEALTPVSGVRSVKVDIPTKRVELDFDDSALSLDQIKQILAEESYPVGSALVG